MILQYHRLVGPDTTRVGRKGDGIMKSVHLRGSFILLGVLSVGFAGFSVETSAQSRSTPERSLSDAVAEVLRSPFHGNRTTVGLVGQSLLLPAVGYANAGEGRATSLSRSEANAEVPLQEVEWSANRLVAVTTFGAVASHITTALFLRCQFGSSPPNDPGRYTGLGRPGVIGLPSGEGESLCRKFDAGSELVAGGFLVLVPTLTTAGAATLSGSGFLRSVGGSALGFVGSLLFYKGMTRLTNEGSVEDLAIPFWFMGGFMHGVVTAYMSG